MQRARELGNRGHAGRVRCARRRTQRLVVGLLGIESIGLIGRNRCRATVAKRGKTVGLHRAPRPHVFVFNRVEPFVWVRFRRQAATTAARTAVGLEASDDLQLLRLHQKLGASCEQLFGGFDFGAHAALKLQRSRAALVTAGGRFGVVEHDDQRRATHAGVDRLAHPVQRGQRGHVDPLRNFDGGCSLCFPGLARANGDQAFFGGLSGGLVCELAVTGEKRCYEQHGERSAPKHRRTSGVANH
jgi:hypothetical protein